MKRLLILLPFLLLAVTEWGQTPAGATRPVQNESILHCRVTTSAATWTRQTRIEVSVAIQSQWKTTVEARVTPALALAPVDVSDELLKEELSYRAFWSLENATILPAFHTVPLQLATGASRKISIDASQLLWARMNSSLLPHLKLFDAVPAGRYSLRSEISGEDGKALCSSEPLNVLIEERQTVK